MSDNPTSQEHTLEPFHDTNKGILDFHKEALSDISMTPNVLNPDPATGDGLVIMARGLGIERLLSTIIQIHTDPHTLVLLVNLSLADFDRLKQSVCDAAEAIGVLSEADGGCIRPDLFVFVNSEISSVKRSELYLAGGVLAVTSQILVLDILNKVLPTHLVTGILVNNAHQVRDVSTEAFILRLYRDENKVGFIKAFSENPEAFVGGFATLERTMKVLYLRSVYFWPRFHVLVKESLDTNGSVELVELRIPMTKRMKEIQAAILDCLHECLLEVKRLNPTLETEEFKLENALFKSFDTTIRIQLDPIWHRVSTKTKQLVNDLHVLRQLLSYLVSYDAVTFYSFLETIMTANAAATTSIYKRGAVESPWLLLDAAHTVFSMGKERVYKQLPSTNESQQGPLNGILSNIEPVLEEQPKWRAIVEVLKEVLKEREKIGNVGNILIILTGDRACRQIRSIIENMGSSTTVSPDTVKNQKSADGKSSRSKASHRMFSSIGSEQLMNHFFQNYLRWKKNMPDVSKTLQDGSALSTTTQNNSAIQPSKPHGFANRQEISSSSAGLQSLNGRNAPANKRRRVKGSSLATNSSAALYQSLDLLGQPTAATFAMEAERIAQFLRQTNDGSDNIGDTDPLPKQSSSPLSYVHVHAYAASSVASASAEETRSAKVFNGDDSHLLEQLKPRWIIMYDPDVAFVRRVELYKAIHCNSEVKVYFLVYDNSVEEQRYLTSIRREKEAFEKLINQKATMAIPIDQDGRVSTDPEELFWKNVDTRNAGGLRRAPSKPYQIIVDVREFRSPLPSLIHAKHIRLEPHTLEVGDYILSPRMCVERKSISDLVSSLKNGRLYNQCEAMCLHYDLPILLIEFEQNRSFSTLSSSEVFGSDISSNDLNSRISLLCLTFPKIGVIWSSSANATAEIFAELKAGEEEPVAADAIKVGVDTKEAIDSAYNIIPSDVLAALPGISTKTYRSVMRNVDNLRQLTEMSCKAMQDMLGLEDGQRLYDFVNTNPSKRGKMVI
ncbi:hypothetical protein BDV3_001823 [Batrachochytrium dendrobatidis]|uniref:ERCC4 domain-containing protein n=1 Tax=Batrachochytrium dendrobatidis (strain JEL423) TaxID=403673 RepID=A0A177WSE1_BATDL|nr:hypothetical protein BDEG_26442 [Batrachochytrium dendrobatidis JEL423]